MTLFTDLVLAGLALYSGLRISEVYWRNYHLFHFHLGWALYLLALGALLGGISHGFGPHFPRALQDFIWKWTLLSIGFVAVFLVLASLSAVVSYDTYMVLRWILWLSLFLYSLAVLKSSDFSLAIKFYVPAILFVLAVMIYLYVDTRDPGAGKIIVGLLISFLGALVWARRVTFHVHFNHNDLYHVFQIAGLWYIYRGGLIVQNVLN